MGSEGTCSPPCQKLLLCSGCGGENLKVQHRAQKRWLKDKHTLSPEFVARQAGRLAQIKTLVDECFTAIGINGRDIPIPTLANQGDRLVELSRPRPLTAQMTAYCIARADRCEQLVDANETDYLTEVGYKAA